MKKITFLLFVNLLLLIACNKDSQLESTLNDKNSEIELRTDAYKTSVEGPCEFIFQTPWVNTSQWNMANTMLTLGSMGDVTLNCANCHIPIIGVEILESDSGLFSLKYTADCSVGSCDFSSENDEAWTFTKCIENSGIICISGGWGGSPNFPQYGPKCYFEMGCLDYHLDQNGSPVAGGNFVTSDYLEDVDAIMDAYGFSIPKYPDCPY